MKFLILICIPTFLSFKTIHSQVLTEKPKDLETTITDLSSEVDQLQSQLDEKTSQISKFNKNSTTYLNEILALQQQIITLQASSKGTKNANERSQIELEIKELQNELNQIQTEFNELTKCEADIQTINKQLESKTRYLSHLSKYSQELDEANKKSLEANIKKANEVIEKEKNERKDFLKSEILLFIGNIEAWASLSSKYELLALSSESLLLFKEKANTKILKILRNGVPDILSLTGGILSLNSFQNDNNAEASLFLVGGIAIKIIPTFFKNKKTKETFEAISRNVAFHDQMIQFTKLGAVLNAKVNLLNQSIQQAQERTEYRPKESDLLIYREIVTTINEIQFQNLELKNKAEFLLELSKSNKHNLSDSGNNYLTKIIENYKKSIENQNILTTIFINRYDLLKTALDNGELSDL